MDVFHSSNNMESEHKGSIKYVQYLVAFIKSKTIHFLMSTHICRLYAV